MLHFFVKCPKSSPQRCIGWTTIKLNHARLCCLLPCMRDLISTSHSLLRYFSASFIDKYTLNAPLVLLGNLSIQRLLCLISDVLDLELCPPGDSTSQVFVESFFIQCLKVKRRFFGSGSESTMAPRSSMLSVWNHVLYIYNPSRGFKWRCILYSWCPGKRIPPLLVFFSAVSSIFFHQVFLFQVFPYLNQDLRIENVLFHADYNVSRGKFVICDGCIKKLMSICLHHSWNKPFAKSFDINWLPYGS